MPEMTLWLARHGQSTVNAGAQSDMDAPLTELGWQQARSLADAVGQQPDLVITSPLLRARQTAMPWLERWPATPQEIWPIQEFVYLSPARCVGSTAQSRRPWVAKYWECADPAYVDGADAESFAAFIARVRAFELRLRQLAPGLVLVFGHGQFLRAFQMLLTQGLDDSAGSMRQFRAQEVAQPVGNTELLDLSAAFSLRAGG